MRIRMKETTTSDLVNLMGLWNNGEVMKFVGFPDGLHYTLEGCEQWLEKMNTRQNAKHYSIYSRDQFLGEGYYSYTEGKKGDFDIKLLPEARGQNVGYRVVCFLIDQLFYHTGAITVTCDPHCQNEKAIKLYQKCGFVFQNESMYQGEKHLVFDLNKATWQSNRIDSVRLEDVTKANFIEVCFLTVHPEQIHFIASNAFSLAQAKYQEECIPKAIYVNDNLVGFLMYSVKDPDDSLVWVYRLMIHLSYQGLGYAKKAMELLIPYLKSISTVSTIRISFEPENLIAKTLYEKLGFVTTGIISDGEVIYELTW